MSDTQLKISIIELKSRLDEMHQDILDLRGDLDWATKLGQPLENNTKYQMEMGRAERRLTTIEKHLKRVGIEI